MNAITYTQCGDYLIPNICISEEESNLPSLTKWGRMRMDYLKNHRPILYNDMKLSGKLFLHCYETEQCADERMEFMMKQAIEKNPISEDLKNTNPLAWVGHTVIVLNTATTKQKLENLVFAAAGITQKYNCALKRLDYQQEQGLMSSLPLGVNQIEIQRGLTTSSTAIFVPFTTCELFQDGEALYYGLNALSNNLIMANRKSLKNPKGLCSTGRIWTSENLQAERAFSAYGQPQGVKAMYKKEVLIFYNSRPKNSITWGWNHAA